MKKALALLMAAAMTISLLSVNVFAATDNYVDNVLSVPKKTVLLEAGVIQPYYSGPGGLYQIPYGKIADGPVTLNTWWFGTDDVEWLMNGTDLVIPLKYGVKAGDKLKLTLDGAEWYFKNGKDTDSNPNTWTYQNPEEGNLAQNFTYDLTKGAFDGKYTYVRGSIFRDVDFLKLLYITRDNLNRFLDRFKFWGTDGDGNIVRQAYTSDVLRGSFVVEDTLITSETSNFNVDYDIGVLNTGIKTVEIPYKLEVSPNSSSQATVTLLLPFNSEGSGVDLYNNAQPPWPEGTTGNSASLRIPLVSRVTTDGEVKVHIDGGNVSTTSSQTIRIANGAGGTKTYLEKTPLEARDVWDYSKKTDVSDQDIVIEELVTGSIRNGLIAQISINNTGYYWGDNWGRNYDNSTATAFDPNADLGIYLDGGLSFADGIRQGDYEPAVWYIFADAVTQYNAWNATANGTKPKFDDFLDRYGYNYRYSITSGIRISKDVFNGSGDFSVSGMSLVEALYDESLIIPNADLWISYRDLIDFVLTFNWVSIGADPFNDGFYYQEALHKYGVTYGYDVGIPNDKLADGYNRLTNVSTSILWIWFGEIKPSDQIRGKILVQNPIFYASDDALLPAEGQKIEVKAHIQDNADNKMITQQDFLIGYRVNWDVLLKTFGTIPTLVSGRYIGPTWDGTDADDATHKTARLQVSEAAEVSWWGQRATILALPATNNKDVKGAKFRKVEVTDSSGIESYIGGGKPQEYKNSGLSAMYSKDNPHGWIQPNDGIYLNDGERHGNITVNDNTITISHLSLKSTGRASITFDLWVSIELGFAEQHGGKAAGELFITIDPASTSLAAGTVIKPVKLANVIDPISVSSKVSDLKIGYQFQTTNDIIITENVAGALLKDKHVSISITDLVNTDLVFSNDVKIAVTAGDLKIKNVIASGVGGFTSQSRAWLGDENTSGAITFDIERVSTAASTVTLSTVGVKIDRTVPVTNKDAYHVMVWDTAVAENYGLSDDKGRAWKADFNTAGVSVPYINIVSSADDAASVLTQEVKVTIGQSYYTVNAQTFTIPTGAEPYLNANGNTMIPVRIVSKALGIRDDQIVWDQINKKVTIFAPSKTLQFTVGEDELTVDGVKIPLRGADGRPVTAEIKQINNLGYTFLPYRALGDAFGISVEWDQATQTATYNKGANSNTNLANTNTQVVTP